MSVVMHGMILEKLLIIVLFTHTTWCTAAAASSTTASNKYNISDLYWEGVKHRSESNNNKE